MRKISPAFLGAARSFALFVGGAGSVAAQVVNPADVQKPPEEAAPAPDQEETGRRLRSWELPETVIVGEPAADYFEEQRVGSYGQPRWTTKRLFPTTRIYVVPEGKVEAEYWTRVKTPREGKTSVEHQYELEIGLPNRFQLDFYYTTEKTGSEGDVHPSQSVELRYALADWGVIPLNPTLYFEWVERDEEPNKYEAKLLLGDEWSPGWHWGSNLVFEHEVSGALENEYGITLGVSHTLIDGKLALGAEIKGALVDEHSDRGGFAEELELGPSLRWQPVPAMHLDFAPLFGIGSDSARSDVFFVLGWEF